MQIDLGSYASLEKVLGKAKNRIHRIGLELEGGWRTAPPTKVVRDGSVVIDNAYYPDVRLIGEIQSPPLTTSEREGSSHVHYIEWMKANHPAYVNATCGMHVHMKMKSALTYQRLMEPSYPATVIEYVKRWARGNKIAKGHPIWSRLAGKSEYCQHKYFPVEQSTVTDKDYNHHRHGCRYTVVNYCWSRWGTVEVRLLPAFDDVGVAISAIQAVLDLTNAYLLVTAKKDDRYVAASGVDNSSIDETTRVTA